jgi:hypothetical protein
MWWARAFFSPPTFFFGGELLNCKEFLPKKQKFFSFPFVFCLCYNFFVMAKILGLDIPAGLEDAYFKIVQFANGSTQNQINFKNTMLSRQKISNLANRSLFVLWQDLYNGFTQLRKTAWNEYWATLPFGSLGGPDYWPGSGYSAFVYLNAPRYRAGEDLLLDPPVPYSLDQYQDIFNLTIQWRTYHNNSKIAQSFIPAYSKKLALASFKWRSYEAYHGYLKCALYSNTSGCPGSLIAISETEYPVHNSITEFFQTDFFFSNTKPSLVSGTTYWLVLYCTDTYSYNGNYQNQMATPASRYSNGKLMVGSDTNTWVDMYPYGDLVFSEYYYH